MSQIDFLIISYWMRIQNNIVTDLQDEMIYQRYRTKVWRTSIEPVLSYVITINLMISFWQLSEKFSLNNQLLLTNDESIAWSNKWSRHVRWYYALNSLVSFPISLFIACFSLRLWQKKESRKLPGWFFFYAFRHSSNISFLLFFLSDYTH